jgi:hypothetical protein
MSFTDEYLEGCVRIATTKIEPHTERLTYLRNSSVKHFANDWFCVRKLLGM